MFISRDSEIYCTGTGGRQRSALEQRWFRDPLCIQVLSEKKTRGQTHFNNVGTKSMKLLALIIWLNIIIFSSILMVVWL